ncbi:hypothetical protein BJF85_06490 [Saccharomonospora sp. CUA-673]|uniref:condensation domain-containing protein n=1 Tax=Saccharomonospora sp. CUA-673 TaxID=1904969 RepID=UPI00096050E2|nr:condensation domain-containing protein [Saccharomonospora sp. CUA-673]OLT39992.1 hypothetical protein BJF85_06490 [Saccharomonospora sp. CUA-673]
MLVTAADRWRVAPGELISWRVDVADEGVPVGLSVNQRNHLGGVRAGRSTVWLASTFEVPGPVDVDALTAAYLTLVGRHSTLQCEVRWDDGDDAVAGGDVHAVRHDPRALSCTVDSSRLPMSSADTVGRLRALLDRECSPVSYPAFVLAAVSRPDVSTVVCGFDHVHGDAHSVAIVARELHAAYRGDADALPAAGSFVERVAEWSAQPPLSDGDERLALWHRMLGEWDFRLPTFPLSLGVADGEVASQRTECRPLADAATVAALSVCAAEAGGSTFAGLVTALARAVRALGGPESTPTLVPVHTRNGVRDESTVGWFTTTVPMAMTTDVATTAANVAAAKHASAAPLDQVLASLPRPLVWPRRDAFMVSYVTIAGWVWTRRCARRTTCRPRRRRTSCRSGWRAPTTV